MKDYKFWVRVALIVAALVIAYLYMLNGRYIKVGDGWAYFDKWARMIVIPGEKNLAE